MAIMKNQTAARLIVRTSLDFNSITITSSTVNYVKPSGVTGTWPSTVLISGKATGDIYLDFSASAKFDEKGIWTLAAKIVFEDGREATGENVVYNVKESV